MRSHRIGLYLGAVVAAVVWCAAARAAEVPVKNVPQPVMDAVKARFKGAYVVGAAEEQGADSLLLYEISLMERGKTIDVMVTPEGALTLIEQQIVRKDLPAAVASTLGKEYPKAKYRIFEAAYEVKDGKETLAYYEVLLLDSKKQAWAVQLGTDGKVIKTEEKKSLDED